MAFRYQAGQDGNAYLAAAYNDDIHSTNFLLSHRLMVGLFSISNAFPTRISIV